MFKQIILSTVLFFFTSCEKENDITQTSINESIPISEGTFVATSGITVSGESKIYIENRTKKVVLENFSISNGPDLKVYLSKSSSPDEFIILGSLTSSTVYLIPEQVDLTEYRYVLIHCQQYNHLFAVAELFVNQNQ